MSKCIYCSELIEHPSVEHIIQYSLGGTDVVSTKDVCCECNSNLGSSIDSEFVSLLPLALMRHEIRIKGQNGNISPIKWKWRNGNLASGTMTLHGEKGISIRINEIVSPVTVSDTGDLCFSIQAHEDNIKNIALKKIERLLKNRSITKNGYTKALQEIDINIEKSTYIDIDRMEAEVTLFNLNAWNKGIAKMALGYGHFLMGAEWSTGHKASILRNFIMSENSPTPNGMLLPFLEFNRSMRLAIGKKRDIKENNIHTICLIPNKGESSFIAISLFGGNGVPEMLVNIGLIPHDFINNILHNNDHENVIGHHIDPRYRTSKTITFENIGRRISTEGPNLERLKRKFRSK